MSSDRKAISNRKNAQNSTGPRSELGRRRSSRNALRHGLAIAIGSDPSFSKDIEALATTLERGCGIAGEFARQLAEAELELQRIRKLKAARFNTVFSLGLVLRSARRCNKSSGTSDARFRGASVLCLR
jgi:hypothetical protein